jgi:hypothetical protein
LETCWLLGFTESEGSFTVSLLSNSNGYRTRFIISQKGDEHLSVWSRLIQLFGVGVIEGHSKQDNYSYIVSGLNNVYSIYPYFDNRLHLFLGIKKDSYLKFKALNERISKGDHLDLSLRPTLINEAKNINPFYVRKAK